MTSVTAAVLVLTIGTPTVAPAWADELTVEERQSWSLEEAREHSDEYFGSSGADVDLVPSTDLDPDHAGSDEPVPEAMPESVPEEIEFPAPGATTLELSEHAAGDAPARSGAAAATASGKAGGLEVALRPAGNGGGSPKGAAGAVQVTNLDQGAARAVGATGGLVTLERAPVSSDREAEAGTASADGQVEVSIDVSPLAQAGGDLAHRLRLVELPACALSTPERAECRAGAPVEGAVLKYGEDGVPQAVTGVVSLDAAGAGDAAGTGAPFKTATASGTPSVTPLRTSGDATVLAVTSDTASSTGDWGATPLSPSAEWDVSAQTGSFSWSYPMRTSPVPGGLVPDLSLSYSSGSLDGRVASTNNQSSQIGDGWEGNFSGYIERKYVPCTEDQAAKDGQAANNASHDTGDLCWKSNNATLVFNGSATELVRDGNTDTWRPVNDDNTVVSHVDGGWNTADNPEYWKLTTTDGTQYWFGRARRSADDTTNLNSTQVVPVYGNHPGEPCYSVQFSASRCSTGYRWNLDYVVDTSGNSMTYFYARDNNRYGYNNDEGTQPYNRSGRLERIEYGTQQGSETAGVAPAQVVFDYAERCIPTSTFDCAESKLTAANSAKWPDVPQDLLCSTSSGCPEVTSPAFFDRKRLTGVTTQVRQGGAYVDVDHWALGQTFPNPGDGTRATVWLESIMHTGKGGSAADVTLPAVQFHGVQLDNRVDETGDYGPAMTRWRIDQITTETGGIMTVNYSAKQCSSTNHPGSGPADLASNQMRCMPVYWTPAGLEDPVQDWFHHYRVTSVVENAQAGGHSAPVETNYLYGEGPKWHYDDNELVRPKHRTWGELRGYGVVSKYVGATGDPDAPRVRTRYRYFQGMHGDRNGSGGTKSVQVDGIDDLDQFSGMMRQEASYSNESDVVDTTLSTPWRSVSTATDPESGTKAFHTAVQETETQTTLASGGNRTSRQVTSFDSIGMPVTVSDLGDVSATGDERCTRITYVRNAADRILETVQRVETVAKRCDADTVNRPADVTSDERFAYDSQAVGAAPVRGRVTLRQEAGSYSGSSPVYVDVEASKYNSFGQLIEQTDANGNPTTTAYDNTSGLTTKTTVTSADPDGSGALSKHVTTTDLSPLWGVPVKVTDPNNKVTTGTYDALGRLAQVWEPGRVQGTDDPSTKYLYMVRDTGVNAVKTETLNHDGSAYVASTQIYDGLLRERQTQAPTASASTAGRVVSDWFYDSRGLATLTRDRWGTSGAPITTLAIASGATDNRTDVTFDGAGRPVREFFQVGIAGEEETPENYLPKWETLTSYEGDRVKVVPYADPATGLSDGGVPTTTVTDVRGNTVELREHRGGGTGSASESTTYRYDLADRLVGVTDPAGNKWSYGYDLRGRQVSAHDPDKGDSSTTYDAVGNVRTSTDARGETLAYTYDALNRKTSMRDDTVSGAIRAQWSYDTVAKGQLTSSVRVDGNDRYTTTVTGYNGRYQPLGQTVTLPESLGAELAGDYTSSITYTADWRVKSQTFPAAGGLGEEQVTNLFSSTNVVDGMGSGYGWGNYVVRADFLPTGELSYLRTGNTYLYQHETFYERGTRRATGSTVFQQTAEQGEELSHATYAYDNAGNVLSAKDVPDPAVSDQPSDQQCYKYDWARRLTEAWTPASGNCATAPSVAGLGGGDPYWMSYSYDVLGNRTGSVVHQATADGGNITSAYTYPASGASSVQPHGVRGVAASGGATGTSSYSYDDAGNMTVRQEPGRAGQTLSWDAEGELAEVATEAGSDEYVYSADGERLVRRQGGATTVYLGGQEITLDAMGSVSAQRYYTFAGKTVAVRTGNLGSHVTSLISDAHNTAVFQISNVANVVTRRYTDPFGADRGAAAGAASGAADQPAAWVGDHGFLDKPVDATGLTAVGARMYDAVLGRFISVDPVMDLADPQQWNAYAYSRNNPTTYSDPTGLREFANDDPRDDTQAQIASAARHSSGGTGRSPAVDPPVYCAAAPYVPPSAWETYSEAAVTVAQEYGHHGVDVVGLIPGAGIPADVANAAWYYSEGDNLNGTLSAIGVIPVVGELVVAGKWVFKGGKWVWNAANAAPVNAVPGRLARVVPADFADTPTLGGPGASDVFVTAADDLAGITSSSGISQRLTLLDADNNPVSGPFAVLEFDTPAAGIASPINRTNPGFVGGGMTVGGAREFVLPNMGTSSLENLNVRTVK